MARQHGSDTPERVLTRRDEKSWAPIIRTRDISDWSGALADTYGALGVRPEAASPFSGSLSRRDFDGLRAFDLWGTPQTFDRTAPMIKRDSANDFMLTIVVEGSGLIVQDGRTAPLSRGEFALVESERPWTMVMLEPCRLVDYSWPREAVDLTDRESRDLTARTFGSDSLMGHLLSPMLMELYRMGGGLSDAGAIRLSRGVADLLVTAALELDRPDDGEIRARRQYDEMIGFIERHLEDPDLTADFVAEAFFFSSRTVHRVFARHGVTVASVIRDLRLEACRTMMLSSAHRHTSISYIASRYGFSGIQVFSRAFAAQYGMAPKAYRTRHQ